MTQGTLKAASPPSTSVLSKAAGAGAVPRPAVRASCRGEDDGDPAAEEDEELVCPHEARTGRDRCEREEAACLQRGRTETTSLPPSRAAP